MNQGNGLPADIMRQQPAPVFSKGLGQSVSRGYAMPGQGHGAPVQYQQHLDAQYRFVSQGFFANNTPQLILAHNSRRTYLLFQNNSAVTIFLSFGVEVQLNDPSAIRLLPNAVYTLENLIVPHNEAYVVASASALLTVVEGSLES